MNWVKKISIIVIAIFLVGLVVTSASYAASEKVGVVNMKRAFYEYDKTKSRRI